MGILGRHDQRSALVGIYTGVTPTRAFTLASPPTMADFGERVDLTANLASILRRYPFGIGLFREIIQNSDDAKATKQVSVVVLRQVG